MLQNGMLQYGTVTNRKLQNGVQRLWYVTEQYVTVTINRAAPTIG
jgi:hypothetical protein